MLLMNWSPQQREIFKWFTDKAPQAKNLCVVARAGTGKSTTIREAVNHAPERDILIGAFNKRIEIDMSARLQHPTAVCKTLHGLGFGFIMSEWRGTRLDAKRGFTLATKVCGAQAPDSMIGLVAKLASIAKGAAPFGDHAALVDLAKRFDLEPDETWQDDGWTTETIAKLAREAMTLACTKDGTIDFDDMVYVALAAKLVRPRYDLVIVDEAQDMNAAQIALATKACRKGGRIVIVGDDRQAIYGWRGADSDALARMQSELAADLLPLTVTYRCPKSVVAEAQRLVPDFCAADSAPDGLVRSTTYGPMMAQVQSGDAILSRKNAPLVSVCLRLLKAGKRARIEGREVGVNLLALLAKLRGNGRAKNDLGRFLERLRDWKETELGKLPKDAEAKAELVCDKAETLSALAEDLATVSELESRCRSLFDDSDKTNVPAIVCSSIHKSKGLEWPTVYVLRDTLFSKYGNGKEEENIVYVAVTRSQATLVYVDKEAKL